MIFRLFKLTRLMKHFNCTLFSLFLLLTVQAQQVETTLNLYADNFPQEKIHIQTDKETYFSSETVWFKAYILADDLPTNISTNLYADLLDKDGNILQHKTMPILASSADSYFTLPDSAQSTYGIRAYTTWMLNFDTAFIYYKTINVTNSKETTAANETPEVSLRFFAEGGNMLQGQYNYIAFKAIQSNGLPYDIKAVIKNSKNEFVDSIASVHNGMGLLKFTPQAGETYVAEWKDNKGDYRRTALPQAQQQGILLHAEQLNGQLYYLINKPQNTDNLQTLTVLATINQRPVYKATIQTNMQPQVNQKFDTKTFPSGILQLTVFDKNNQPLAERVVFINNKNYSFTTKLNVTQSSTKKRGKNKIEITVPDTLGSNLSLAVYDASLEQQQTGRNIYTDLLLQGDLKGYVYNANWYFSDTATHAAEYLDLVMQTNGWRRYNWDKIIANQMPAINFTRDSYLSIYGKATNQNQQPVANKPVSLMLQTQDSAKQWYTPTTNKEGLFTQAGLIFYDTAFVYYKPSDTKNDMYIGMAKDFNGLSAMALSKKNLPGMPAVKEEEATAANTYTQSFITEIKNKNPGFENQGKLMSEVIVKTNSRKNWKNDPMLKMDEKYATGSFRGGATSNSFDLLNDATAVNAQDIFNYLSGRIPGMKIQFSNMGKTILVPDPEVSGTYIPPLIYVDENEQDNEYLRTLSIEDIAYVKYFEHSYGRVAAEQQKIPTLAIYLKKGKDYATAARLKPGSLSKIPVTGYSPIKEFYSPDYSAADANNARADLRTTLLWKPYIITNKENNKTTISFYNNDISNRLKIVLEGMNEDGKLIHIEKIIE